RDFHVTGVQTCALPISDRQRGHRIISKEKPRGSKHVTRLALKKEASLPRIDGSGRPGRADKGPAPAHPKEVIGRCCDPCIPAFRSEERRVGKECQTGEW